MKASPSFKETDVTARQISIRAEFSKRNEVTPYKLLIISPEGYSKFQYFAFKAEAKMAFEEAEGSVVLLSHFSIMGVEFLGYKIKAK